MDEHTLLVIVCTVAAVVAAQLVLLMLFAGFSTHRVGLAITVAWRTLGDSVFADRIKPMLTTVEEPKPTKPSGAPLWLLAILQREGRLVDFLLEDIQQAAESQIAAAVREIHPKCKKVLNDHLVLEAVLPGAEGATVEVAKDFDPSAIRLTGNVTGEPPFKGTLMHAGWRVKELKLAPPPKGHDEFVLQPAEVELP